jgi:hypothetical protein
VKRTYSWIECDSKIGSFGSVQRHRPESRRHISNSGFDFEPAKLSHLPKRSVRDFSHRNLVSAHELGRCGGAFLASSE